MPEPRTFVTHGQYESGGTESEALGLPFSTTPCEDWYGFGDARCPSRYIETGDLEADIISLKKWVGFYSLRKSGGGWLIKYDQNANLPELLARKQSELKAIQKQRAWLQLSDEEQQRQQRLIRTDEMIVKLEAELSFEKKLEAGYHRGHPILTSGRFNTIPILEAKIKQKKTRN